MNPLSERIRQGLEDALMTYRTASNLATDLAIHHTEGNLDEAEQQERNALDVLRQWVLYAENKDLTSPAYTSAKDQLTLAHPPQTCF